MVKRSVFLSDSEVSGFVEWLREEAIKKLKVSLTIPPSPKVPGGVKGSFVGLSGVVAAYKWRSTGREADGNHEVAEDWPSTRSLLAAFRDRLQKALKEPPTEREAFAVCQDILRWGGNRNPNVGAEPFLKQMHKDRALERYLRSCQQRLRLECADESQAGAQVKKMNSMLTKVHALAACDGLPIYDSRVAVAIASLVELYRRKKARNWTDVPGYLKFPSLDRARDVQACFAEALSHGSCAQRGDNTIQPWTSAKIRLGWILEAALKENQLLSSEELGGETMQGRMHAFEAGLFMIGYDARCLAENFPNGRSSVLCTP